MSVTKAAVTRKPSAMDTTQTIIRRRVSEDMPNCLLTSVENLYLSIVNGKGGRLQVEAGTVVVKAAEVQYYLANV